MADVSIINLSWTSLKGTATAKSLFVQYQETSTAYEVFVVDGIIIYQSVIFKGSVPDANYSQVQNDADKADFEANYKNAIQTNTVIAQAAVGPIADGYETTGNPVVFAGIDGSSITRTAQSRNSNPSGSEYGVVVRNIPSGTQAISGTVTANAGTGTFNIAGTVTANLGTVAGLALDATLTGGTQRTRITDGTNNAALTNTTPTGTEYAVITRNIPSGTQTVSGTVTANAGTGNFTVVQSTAANLNAQVVGNVASGSAVSGNPVRVGGSDGTNVRNILTDTSGRLIVGGAAAAGAAVAGNPVLMGASDGTNAQTLRSSTTTPAGTEQGLITRNIPSGTQAVSGTVTANAGTGNFNVIGTGTAGAAATGVVTVQGIAGGTAIPVSGTITANNASVGSTGAATPASATLAGGSDGTNLQAFRTSASAPAGTEQGLITRNIPSGTQTISGTVSGTGNFNVIGTNSDNSSNTTTKVGVLPARANTAAPTWTDGYQVPLSVDTSGALRITGTISAPNASVGSNGAAIPTSSTLIAASDGTNLQQLRSSTSSPAGTENGLIVRNIPSGTQAISGTVTANAGTGTFTVSGTVTANIGTTNGLALDATLTGGTQRTKITDGTNNAALTNTTPAGTEYAVITRNIPSGTQTVSGTVTANAGTGSFTVAQATASNLNATVVGSGSAGTPATGVVTVQGIAGGTTIPVSGTVTTTSSEAATFVSFATGIALGNNKSMLSITNTTGSGVNIKIREIYLVNVQTTAVTGVAGNFELRRCTSHSGGTAITAIEKMDSSDVLNANVTVRTNATITGESTTLLWRSLFSTDEWSVGSLDTEGNDHIFQTMFPIFKQSGKDTKALLLKPNEGLTVKFATNSTAGTFDIVFVFTQE
jgi:hypothetical protein